MAFLAIEGIDGSGKSSLINLLYEGLKKQGLACIKTKEPGGTKTGKKIRELLLEDRPIDPLTETLLCYADRKQHVEELIKPSLKKGLWVLSDRYWASSSAYQASGRGLDEKFIEQIKQKVCAGCEPDLWILLDLPVTEALKRLLALKKDNRDRLEMESNAFHQKVRDGYLELSKKKPAKWLVMDAMKPSKQLLKELLSHLKQIGII